MKRKKIEVAEETTYTWICPNCGGNNYERQDNLKVGEIVVCEHCKEDYDIGWLV